MVSRFFWESNKILLRYIEYSVCTYLLILLSRSIKILLRFFFNFVDIFLNLLRFHWNSIEIPLKLYWISDYILLIFSTSFFKLVYTAAIINVKNEGYPLKPLKMTFVLSDILKWANRTTNLKNHEICPQSYQPWNVSQTTVYLGGYLVLRVLYNFYSVRTKI